MKVAQLSERAEEHIVFRDGLGVRARALTEAGEAVHRFTLDEAFTPVQQAVQDRVKRLTNLHHVKFARLRGFEKAPKQGGAPVVISAEVEGIRLADTLLSAAHGLVDVSVGQALQITREVLAALAVLHDSRNVTHGSLAPERVVLTPHGRVLVVEHVLAQALEKLQLPRHQLWRDWRIATPPAAGPVRFDARTDLAQAGLLVLAATLGRSIDEDEYPHRLRGLLPAVTERLGRAMGTTQARELQAWLERLLPIESRRPFTSVKEAQLAFENLVSKPASSLGMSPAKVKALVASCLALQASSAAPEPVATSVDAPGAQEAPETSAAAAEPITFIVAPADDLASVSVEGTSAGAVAEETAVTESPDEVDIEALLRLAAELEEAAAEAPAQAVEPIVDAPAAPFEIVHEEPQEEPSAEDVAAVVQEIDLGPSLAVLTESRPAEVVAWDVAPTDLQHLAHERDELHQQFADILSLVAPAAPSPSSSLVQDTVRWTFEPEPPQEAEPPVAWLATAGVEDTSSAAEAPCVEVECDGESERVSTASDQPTVEPAEVHAAEVYAAEPPAAEPPAVEAPAPELPVAEPPAAESPRVIAWMTPVADAIDDVVLAVTAPTTVPDDAPAAEPSEQAAVALAAADHAASQTEVVADADVVPDLEVVAPEFIEASSGEPDELPATVEASQEIVEVGTEELPETCAVGSEELPAMPVVETLELVGTLDDTPAALEDVAPTFLVSEAPDETVAADVPLFQAALDDAPRAEAEALVDEWAACEHLADLPAEDLPAAADAEQPAVADVEAAVVDAVDVDAAQPDASLAEVAAIDATFEELSLDVAAASAGGEHVEDEPVSVVAPARDGAELSIAADVALVEIAEDAAAIAIASTAVTIDDVEQPAAVHESVAAVGDVSAEVAEPVVAPDEVMAAVAEPLAAIDEPVAVLDEPVAVIAAYVEVDDAPAAVLETPAAGDVAPDGLVEPTPLSADDIAGATEVAAACPIDPVDASAVADAGPVEVEEAATACVAADAAPSSPLDVDADAAAPADADDAAPVEALALPDALDKVESVEPAGGSETVAWIAAPIPVGASDVVAAESPLTVPDDVVDDVEPAGMAESVPDSGDGTSLTDVAVLDAFESEATAAPTVAEDVERLSGDVVALDAHVPAAADEPVVLAEVEPSVSVADGFVASDPHTTAGNEAAALSEVQPSVSEPLDADITPEDAVAALVADEPAAVVDEPPAEADADVPQAAEAPVVPVAETDADAAPADEDATAPPATDSGGVRSKRRRSRRKSKKRESAPAPHTVVALPTVVPAVAAVAVEPEVVAPAPVAHAVPAVADPPAPLVSVTRPAASSAEVSSSAPRRSLVERDVPVWQPPADLRAVGAAAATRGIRTSVAAVPSEAEVALPADSGPFVVQAPAPELPTPELVESVGATSPQTAADAVGASAPDVTASLPVAAMSTASIVPEEYRSQGGQFAGETGGGSRMVAAPQVTTVGDSGFSAPDASSDAEPGTRTVVVFTSRINWRRTIAAGLVLALLESAAFAAAWWWVQPGAKGTLVVETTVPGVEVLLDGAAVGQTPFHDEVRPGRHTLTLRRGGLERSVPVEISLGVVTTQTISWPDASTGALRVTSSPEGAEVVVGGRVRGRTPLTVDGLDAGKHTITLRSSSGTVSASATVVSGETTDVDVPIFAGWIVVNAPVDVAVSVDGTRVGSSLDGQILLAPGAHRIEVANESLGFREALNATVEPGKVRRLTVTLPDVPLQVAGEDGAEVFVDGLSRGTLPAAVTVPLGTHELVLRRPDGTERRRTLTVRAGAPVTFE